MERWDTLWPGGWTVCFGAMVHVSSDRASPRLPNAVFPPPAGK